MTWQDDLRQLDAEVAAGRISPEDYQRRRDDLVAAASGAGPTAPPPGQPQEPSPPPSQQEPSPPPSQQEPSPPPSQEEPSASESTQLIPPVPAESPPSNELPADATQVVQLGSAQPPSPGDRTQIVSPQARAAGTEWDRTQVVPGGLRPQPQGFNFPQPQPAGLGGSPGWGQPDGLGGSPGWGQPEGPGGQPGWGQSEAAGTPPWGNSDLPPFGTGAPWIQQGPEVAESAGGGTPVKIIMIIAAVVVLLGAAGFGAYWIWGRGGTTQQAAATTQPSQPGAPTPSTPPSTPSGSAALQVANLPGTAQDHSDIKSFADVAKLTYLNPSELQAYQAAKAGDAMLAVRMLPKDTATVVLLVQGNSNGAAATAVQTLDQVQRTNGMVAANNAPAGVRVSEIPAKDGEKAKIRGHYAHNGVIVRVEEIGPDLSSLRQDFRNALEAELKIVPADG